ncbi:MAG: tetratricopeptide repeat protein [Candidatus Obscuribacterales bacterium]|nr:tetratricopeptide repeat protein [Candidatus Obscuribacterales bacterium]
MRFEFDPFSIVSFSLVALLLQPCFAKSDGTFPGKGNYSAWVNANHFLKFGNDFAEKGQLDKALESYKHAIHTYPFDSIYYFNMGNAFALKQQYPIAEEAYQKAIELEENYFQAWLNLGHTIARQGRPQEAAKALRRAAELSKDPNEKAEIEKTVSQLEQLPENLSPQNPKDSKKKKIKKSRHTQ